MYDSCYTIEQCKQNIQFLESKLKHPDEDDNIEVINTNLKTLKSQLGLQLPQQNNFNNIMNHVIGKSQYSCKNMLQLLRISLWKFVKQNTIGRKKISTCPHTEQESDILLCRFKHDETSHNAMVNTKFKTYVSSLFDLHFDNWVNTIKDDKQCIKDNENIRHMYEDAMISVFFFSFNNNNEDLLPDYQALFPIKLANSFGLTSTKTGGKTSRKKSTRKRKQKKSKKSRSKKI